MGEWSCNGKCPLLQSLMADGSVGLLLFTGDPPAPKNRKLIFRSDALVPVCQNTAIFFIYISKLLYTRSDRLRGWKGLYGTGGETALTLHLLPQTSTYSLPQRSTLRAIQSTFMPGLLTSLLLLSISFLSSLGTFRNHITCLLCLQNKTLRARHTRSCQLSTDFPYNFLCSSYCY